MGTGIEEAVEESEGPGSDDADVALVAAAAAGDRAAAGAYFQKNRRLLMTMARRIGGGVLEPDDLFSEATLILLSKWSQGAGPNRYATAYLLQIMRNRVKDELKSARYGVVAFSELAEITHEDEEAIRVIDLHSEYAVLLRALDSLPAAQRDVLVATVVNGRKPRELEEELGRPASSIYSLALRARMGLRTAMLRFEPEEERS